MKFGRNAFAWDGVMLIFRTLPYTWHPNNRVADTGVGANEKQSVNHEWWETSAVSEIAVRAVAAHQIKWSSNSERQQQRTSAIYDDAPSVGENQIKYIGRHIRVINFSPVPFSFFFLISFGRSALPTAAGCFDSGALGERQNMSTFPLVKAEYVEGGRRTRDAVCVHSSILIGT